MALGPGSLDDLLPSQEGYSQVTTHQPFIKEKTFGKGYLQHSVTSHLPRDCFKYNLSQAYSYHVCVWIKI